jgi:hypothetical protein
MRKFLLNLAPGEPLALVRELPGFDNFLKLDPLICLSTIWSLDSYCIQSWLISVGVGCSTTSEVSNNGGK